MTYFSVSSFCLTFFVCFYVLRKTATFPTLASSDLTKKRSCSALKCSVLCSPEPGVSGCFLCGFYVLYCCGWAAFAFSPVSAVSLFACCGQSLVLVLLVDQVEDAFGQPSSQLSHTTCLPVLQLHWTARCSPCVVPEKISLVFEACSQTRYLPKRVFLFVFYSVFLLVFLFGSSVKSILIWFLSLGQILYWDSRLWTQTIRLNH